MIFISVTRLRVKSILFLPSFFLVNNRSVKELIITPGFFKGKELLDKNLTFWTMTAWKDLESMKTFRNSGAHRKAMQKLPGWCNEASYVHWMQETDVLPTWTDAHLKMLSEGKTTKVKQPTQNQLLKTCAAPAWQKSERILLPKA